jgi:hypothetical protein
VHFQSHSRELLDLFDLVLEVTGDEELQIDLESSLAGVVLPPQRLLLQFHVLFWKQVLAKVAKSKDARSVSVEISEDEVEFEVGGVDLVL